MFGIFFSHDVVPLDNLNVVGINKFPVKNSQNCFTQNLISQFDQQTYFCIKSEIYLIHFTTCKY